MEAVVSQCFESILSPAAGSRAQAEAQLDSLGSDPGFPLFLTRVLLDKTSARSYRQLSVTTLKRYIGRHWDSSSPDDTFVGPETPEDVKRTIHAQLLPALAEEDRSLRLLIANLIAIIAAHDWPTNWPELWPFLLSSLKSYSSATGEVPAVSYGSVFALSEFIDQIPTSLLLEMAADLLPTLHGIVADNACPLPLRARTLRIFGTVCQALSAHLDTDRSVIKNIATTYFPNWVALLQGLFQTLSPDCIAGHSDKDGLLLEALHVLGNLSESFPKLVDASLPTFLLYVGNLLLNLKTRFREEILESEEASVSSNDGDNVSFSYLLQSLMEFFQVAFTRSTFRKLLRPELPNLVPVLLEYMQISDSKISLWLEDLEAFLSEDDPDTFAFSCRITAERLLFSMLSGTTGAFQRAACQAVVTSAQEIAGQQLSLTNWKLFEASMLIIGRSCEEIAETLPELDLASYVTAVVLPCLQIKELPFLSGRALWLSSELAAHLPIGLAEKIYEYSIERLDPEFPVPLRVAALRAIHNFVDIMDPSRTSAHAEFLLRNLPLLIHSMFDGGAVSIEAHTSDMHILILDTLQSIVNSNVQCAVRLGTELVQPLLDLWVKTRSDVMIGPLYVALIGALVPESLPVNELVTRASCMILSESSPDTEVLLSSAFELLGTCIRHVPQTSVDDLLQVALPVTVAVMNKHLGDSYIQQHSAYVLRYALHRSPRSLASVLLAPDMSVLSVAVSHVVGLLTAVEPGLGNGGGPGAGGASAGSAGNLDYVAPDAGAGDDTCSLALPALCVQLIRRRQECGLADGDLNRLLDALLLRLERRPSRGLRQQLVLAFARLILSDAGATTGFLSAWQSSATGANGLVVLLDGWSATDFDSDLHTVLSARALATLMSMKISPLYQIPVSYSSIFDAPESKGKRATRSAKAKAAKETAVVIPAQFWALKSLVTTAHLALQEHTLITGNLARQKDILLGGQAAGRGADSDDEHSSDSDGSDEEGGGSGMPSFEASTGSPFSDPKALSFLAEYGLSEDFFDSDPIGGGTDASIDQDFDVFESDFGPGALPGLLPAMFDIFIGLSKQDICQSTRESLTGSEVAAMTKFFQAANEQHVAAPVSDK
ncbi:hypothetical protein H696_05568 [Fonticula alba]|uniref:Importin N-terminal domain-containing protein n=1 Tax=Fonticula alba TaxID=691883 RepID=A0A058Z124_FONAL|nr:hypothetical protein H696_05568 [Fonticula alba]KCV67836.1 hypothetical protein H696_05568 [Fonticula alba]|eukprot:XP_009497656.1 hypothetical protein H696_05568 [Fonticula alba]